jgi:hypothetical protein
MNSLLENDVFIYGAFIPQGSMRMSLWQKCTIALLGIAIFGGVAYFARIVFRPVGLDRLRSIPWVTYVHPNVKKLKQALALARDGKLDEARAILVKALITAPKSPVTRELRDYWRCQHTNLFLERTFASQNRIHILNRQ